MHYWLFQNVAENSLLEAASEEQRKVDEKVMRLAEEQRVYTSIVIPFSLARYFK